MSLARYFHTVRHLRPVQVYGRLLHRLARPKVRALAAADTPPLAAMEGAWVTHEWREPSLEARENGPARFTFLGEARDVATAADWDDARVPRLWRYNLHYFDDLVARDAPARSDAHRALLAQWIAANPPGRGTAWEPYPTSLRVVNWVKADVAARARGGALLDDAARASLALQVRWLRGRLERHLQGNHLWANAKALVVAGAYFGGSEGDAWLAEGATLFRAELAEQVLPDGGHYERSPMYHATMLKDVLDLLAFARAGVGRFPRDLRDALEAVAPRMLRWLRVMTHPDGHIAFFNDAALGIAPDLGTLAAYARALGVPDDQAALDACEVLRESGYVRLSNARAVVICDIAPVGPDHLPAHAHADTLSFELSVDGARVLVNSGTSTYERGAERDRQRGTASHNTVVVDGADSSETWASFRVARRARARLIAAGERDGVAFAEGEHDGYRRLPGRVTHRRRWELRDRSLTLVDALEGRWRVARAMFLLAPARTVDLAMEPAATREEAPATWHPAFGASVPTSRVAVVLPRAPLRTTVRW